MARGGWLAEHGAWALFVADILCGLADGDVRRSGSRSATSPLRACARNGIHRADISVRFVSHFAIISRVMGKPIARNSRANSRCDLRAFRRNVRSLSPRLTNRSFIL